MTPRASLSARLAAATTAIALVAAAACTDKPAQPTAPRAPRQAAATAVVPAPTGVSTVCLAYMTKQSVAQQKLEDAQKQQQSVDDQLLATLRRRVEKLDEIVADACS